MKSKSLKKVLVAIDGSEDALEAVRYASTVLQPGATEVVLFHALRKIDDAFWNIGIKTGLSERLIDIAAWEAAQDEAAKKIMDLSRKYFIDQGFHEDQVIKKIHRCEQGVARDIVEESKHDYEAVFLGRRGMSKLKDLVVGGTAQKLIEKTAHIPVCVVDIGASAKKLLIAVDASEGAMKAIDYAGAVFGRMDVDVVLVHVLHDITGFEPSYGMAYPGPIITEPAEWLELEEQEVNKVFDKAKGTLVSSGIDAGRISSNTIKATGNRAQVAVRVARETGCGSIIVGRRGISKVEEFIMGSMSNKVLHLAKGMAVWVVS
jgi:nucleotide-binding universal stress UspA family protein